MAIDTGSRRRRAAAMVAVLGAAAAMTAVVLRPDAGADAAAGPSARDADVLGRSLARPGAGASPAGRGPVKRFAVTGTTDPLFPGARRDLRLTVRNPHNFAIRVTSISVSARDAHPSCASANIRTTDYVGSLVVGRNATAWVIVPIEMAPDAADACRNATFPLVFGGSAVKA